MDQRFFASRQFLEVVLCVELDRPLRALRRSISELPEEPVLPFGVENPAKSARFSLRRDALIAGAGVDCQQ
jgi:hypothetical protein